MILIDATTMWQCETCYWHGKTGCSSPIYCENGEGYRPSIDKLKQIDAEPVVHGHWIICSDGYYPYCSKCKQEPGGKNMTNYCPHCGAKMDEEEH